MTLAEARRAAAARLAAAGVEDAALDARLLVQAATDLDAAALAAEPERVLDAAETGRLEAMLARRAAREPMSQILGRVGFWTLDLLVTPDVLSPRPETEQVLEAALGETEGRAEGRVLDLGVGSGALLLAFLSERPGWSGVGTDASEAAVEVARSNASASGLASRASFLCTDWDAGLAADAKFDLVLSNPPYIPTAEIETLEPEVRDFEPRAALDGGADGLGAYRVILARLNRVLAAGGTAVFEIGTAQGASVTALARNLLAEAEVRLAPDLSGRDRVVIIRSGRAGP